MLELREEEIRRYVHAARERGLDGTDRGAVRRFLWWECVYSDAVDDGVTQRIAELLLSERDARAA